MLKSALVVFEELHVALDDLEFIVVVPVLYYYVPVKFLGIKFGEYPFEVYASSAVNLGIAVFITQFFLIFKVNCEYFTF